MNHKIMRTTGILLAAAAAAAVLALGINWAQAEGTAAPVQTAAQTSAAFTYQGQLVYNGTAVNGTCDLTFRLYDAPSFGTQIGSNLQKSSVSVNDGIFTVDLDFGDGAFSGDARYLQIDINSCTNGASGVTLPMIELKAAPYALGLRPGAVISGSTGTMLTGWSESNSTAAIGLYGYAKSSSYAAYGVKGEISGAGGNGVYGVAPYGGIYGLATATSTTSYGVTGESRSSDGTGVYGWASAASGTTYGVYGEANSPNGYGVYSQGNAHVDGQLTWKPITSYLSIPAAAFVPQDNYYDGTTNYGSYVRTNDLATAVLQAPVQLPNGSTVTSMRVYWSDNDNTITGTIYLYRSNFTAIPLEMASVTTSDTGGSVTSAPDSSINYDQIDNSQYTYYVSARLPSKNSTNYVGLYGVVIEYTIDRPY